MTFEGIPYEVLLGPVSILGRECSIFPLASVNIYGMQNKNNFNYAWERKYMQS